MLAVVDVERREYAHGFVNLLAGNLPQTLAHLGLSVVAGVHLGHQLHASLHVGIELVAAYVIFSCELFFHPLANFGYHSTLIFSHLFTTFLPFFMTIPLCPA